MDPAHEHNPRAEYNACSLTEWTGPKLQPLNRMAAESSNLSVFLTSGHNKATVYFGNIQGVMQGLHSVERNANGCSLMNAGKLLTPSVSGKVN